MKILKIIFGSVVALVLLVGGFTAGTFIPQTRTASATMVHFAQATFIPQQQIQPTLVLQQIQPTSIPQQQFQPTVVPQQLQVTPVPQTTPLAIPPMGQWGRAWSMTLAPGASAGVNPNYVPQGESERGWMMMSSNSAPQNQRGWGMYGRDYDNCDGGWHDGWNNGYGGQTYPNSYPTQTAPNDSPYYPTPSVSVSFRNNVQPIFAARCIACHGGTNGLFLDTYENVLKGGVNGAVVIPGDVYNSRLAYYVYGGYMPFRSTPLTSTETQPILDWIALGAPNN